MVNWKAADVLGLSSARAGEDRRAFEPEALEHREFLAGRVRGFDREAARRQAIDLVAADRAKIAGAEESTDLVEIIGAIDRRVDAKPGKAEIVDFGFGHMIKVEQVGDVFDRHGAAADHLRDVDAAGVEEAAMEELRLELGALAAPECLGRVESDRAVLVIFQVLELVREGRVRRFERLGGQGTREVDDGGGVEWGARWGCWCGGRSGGGGPARRPCDGSGRGQQGKQAATLQGDHSDWCLSATARRCGSSSDGQVPVGGGQAALATASVMARATASATRMPSMPADRMPPAYPAPSPAG